MNQKNRDNLAPMYALTDDEIHSQTVATLLMVGTNIKAGLTECVSSSYEETAACCAKHPHAGPITGPPSDQLYSCYVDSGTGNWD